MALLSRKDFAKICEVPVSSVNVGVSRGNIFCPKKLIDTEHPINIKFKERQLMRQKQEKKIKVLKKKVLAAGKDEPVLRTPAASKKELTADKKAAAEYAEWARRKEQAGAIKIEKEAELKTLQVEKMMGKLMPVELVHQILKINIQNVFIGFENELQNIASIYCDILAGGDRAKLSKIIKDMREKLERIIKETEKNAAKEIEGVIDEYSESRNRGERN